MSRPSIGYGMRHVALFVRDLGACERFYVDLIGMQVEWRPDARNVYLTSGGDNLALHQADAGPDSGADRVPDTDSGPERDESVQRLDHIGFFVAGAEDVDAWFAWLKAHGVRMRTEPRTHRDGARSFYCYDPDGTQVQIIHHPPIAQWEGRSGAN